MGYRLTSCCQVCIQPDCQGFLILSNISGSRTGKNFVTRELLLQQMLFNIKLRPHAIKNFRLNEANSFKILLHFKCRLQDQALS